MKYEQLFNINVTHRAHARLTYLLGAYVFVESGHGHVFCQWRLLSLFPLALAVLLFLLGLMIPESPRRIARQTGLEEAHLKRIAPQGPNHHGSPATGHMSAGTCQHLATQFPYMSAAVKD